MFSVYVSGLDRISKGPSINVRGVIHYDSGETRVDTTYTRYYNCYRQVDIGPVTPTTLCTQLSMDHGVDKGSKSCR